LFVVSWVVVEIVLRVVAGGGGGEQAAVDARDCALRDPTNDGVDNVVDGFVGGLADVVL
jgi:hypothetical protein